MPGDKPSYEDLEVILQDQIWEHAKTRSELERVKQQRDEALRQRDKIWNWMAGLHQATASLLWRVNNCEQCGLEANGDIAEAVHRANAALEPMAEARPLAIRSALEGCLRLMESYAPMMWGEYIIDVRLALGKDEYREPLQHAVRAQPDGSGSTTDTGPQRHE